MPYSQHVSSSLQCSFESYGQEMQGHISGVAMTALRLSQSGPWWTWLSHGTQSWEIQEKPRDGFSCITVLSAGAQGCCDKDCMLRMESAGEPDKGWDKIPATGWSREKQPTEEQKPMCSSCLIDIFSTRLQLLLSSFRLSSVPGVKCISSEILFCFVFCLLFLLPLFKILILSSELSGCYPER